MIRLHKFYACKGIVNTLDPRKLISSGEKDVYINNIWKYIINVNKLLMLVICFSVFI